MAQMKSSQVWLFYDMGSSAYALTVGTLFFPVFFVDKAARGTATSSGWAVAVLLASLAVGISAPPLGELADRHGWRNRMFIIFGLVSVVGTALLPIAAWIPVAGAVALFVVVHVSFNVATNFYDSYISLYGQTDQNYAKRSGLGWALGYLGGLLCLVPILLLLRGKVPSTIGDYWVVFGCTAGFYGAFSLFVFRHLPQDPKKVHNGVPSWKASISTLKGWRLRRRFFLTVLASILITDGMTTLLYFTSTYVKEELHFSLASILVFFVVLQVSAVPATWVLTRLAVPVGESNLLILCCVVWCLLTMALLTNPGLLGMYLLAVGVGAVVGTTPATLRSLFGRLVPPDERGELFGFTALGARAGAVLGPALFLVALKLWGHSAAIATVVPSFIIGAGLLWGLGDKHGGVSFTASRDLEQDQAKSSR